MTEKLSQKRQEMYFEWIPIIVILVLVFFIPMISKYIFGDPLKDIQASQKEIEREIDGISTKLNFAVSSGDQYTGGILPGYTVDLLAQELDFSQYPNEEYKQISFYPKIHIGNGNLEYAELRFQIDFNERYKKEYKNLIYGKTSDGKTARYVFALKYFIGDFDNGGYVNVYRTSTNNVDNLVDDGLFGAYLGTEIIGGRDFIIPLRNVKVAKESGSVGYTIRNDIDFLNKNKGNVLYIGGWLSGREGTLIKKMEIYYEGDEGVISLAE